MDDVVILILHSEEKRKGVTKTESKSSLRPSLASRLGPSPHNRKKSDEYPKGQR